MTGFQFRYGFRQWPAATVGFSYGENTILMDSFGEVGGALHRLRLIHGTDNKNVFLITDCMVDVSIDELVDRHKELGEKSIAVIKHIKDQKFILDTNEAFSEKFGWKEAEAKDFRLARTYGDWMKNHRSLAYWKYHTKDRKTGKAYSYR